MIKFFALVLSICALFVENGASNNIRPRGLSTAPPLLHGPSPPSSHMIDDNDYWDDDYVPYKEDRHDSFDWMLFKETLLHEVSNAIISPFSLKLVLSLLDEAAGPETKTKQELSKVFPNLKKPHLIHEVYQSYLSSLNAPSTFYKFNLGTKLFTDQIVNVKQRYAALIKTHYGAETESLKFSDGVETAKTINNWVSDVTEGNIKDIVTKDSVENSILLMINAIYFDGLWRNPFENQTFEMPFFTEPTRHIPATYMTLTDKFFFFVSKQLDAKIVRLPYKGKKFSMTIVLPLAKGGVNELIKRIDGDSLKRVQWLMDEVQVKLTIPKFKFDYTGQMKPILQKLGLEDIFNENASLPGIDRGRGLNNQLKVSNIIQKAGIAVHEKGSTAYAASRVDITNKFGGVEDFNANRPFIFFIEDETTGNMIFTGKVVDPTV